jgi:hypothetical protein
MNTTKIFDIVAELSNGSTSKEVFDIAVTEKMCCSKR